jgi:hypothetical protein
VEGAISWVRLHRGHENKNAGLLWDRRFVLRQSSVVEVQKFRTMPVEKRPLFWVFPKKRVCR